MMSFFRVNLSLVEPKGAGGLTERTPVCVIGGDFLEELNTLMARCNGGGGCIRICNVQFVVDLMPDGPGSFKMFPIDPDRVYYTKKPLIETVCKILKDISSSSQPKYAAGREFIENNHEIFQCLC